MTLLQLISRQIGAADIAWGTESFSWTDENGISRTMSQVNASQIPIAGAGGSVGRPSSLWILDSELEMVVVDVAGNISVGLLDPSAGYTIEHYCDGVGAYKIRSTATNYSQFSLGVDTLNGYTFIQSNKDGTGTQLPISFWISSGVGAIRAWDISTSGHLLSGGTGADIRNIKTAGKITSSTMAATGLVAYPNNAAALTAGLVAGDFYRNAAATDYVCVVH